VHIDFKLPEVLSDGRDRSVIRFQLPPTPSSAAVHVCILWDADRDQNILAVLAALYLRHRDALKQLVAVAETRGQIAFWCRSADQLPDMRRALDDAANAVTWQHGRWRAGIGHVVPCKGTVVDWAALAADHPLRGAARGQQLGLVEVTR
jgi:hypothetical protein